MTRTWDRRRGAAIALALVVAGACSSPQGTEAGNSLLGKKERKDGGGRDRGKAAGGPSKGKAKTGGVAAPTVGDAAAEVAPEPGETPLSSGAAKTETNVTSSGTDPRTASVVVTEPDPDQEKSGIVPDYSDIVTVRVEGLGSRVRFTLTFRGALPEKMPDDKTYMVAGIGITDKNRDKGYAFGASADESGWKAYGESKDETGEYPGTLSVSGADVVFTLPWAAIGGAKPFEWYGQATWFKSLAGTTHYSLDVVPNDGPARFPAG